MTDITANVVVSMPSQLFTMARSFKAVANGKIYIGKIDTDPVNPENQIQVYVENEDCSHVPVSQPIIINAAGYPVYNGQIAKFVTVHGHSMAVYDAYGAQQFYFPNVLKYDPDQLRSQIEYGQYIHIPDGYSHYDEFDNIPLNILGVDYSPVNVYDVSYDVLTGIFKVSVQNADNFHVGKYCILSGRRDISCGAMIISKDGNVLTLDMSHNGIISGPVNGVVAKPINSIIKTTKGIQFRSNIYSIKNVAIETDGDYGLIIGGGYYPDSQCGSCVVWDANNLIVNGGSVCGVLVSGSGSQFCINEVHITNANISLECIYAASVKGFSFSSYNSNEDSIKVEHASSCYIKELSIIKPKTQSCVAARYSSSVEISDCYMVGSEGSAFATSQFSSYLSLRNIVMLGSAKYAINCVDGAVVAINNIDASLAKVDYGVRVEKHSVLRQVGINSNFSGSIADSLINNSHVDFNDIVFSGKKIKSTINVGSINPNSRFSIQRVATGYKIENELPINMTVLGDLPIGVITDVLAISDDMIRVIFQNTSSSPVDVGSVDVIIGW